MCSNERDCSPQLSRLTIIAVRLGAPGQQVLELVGVSGLNRASVIARASGSPASSVSILDRPTIGPGRRRSGSASPTPLVRAANGRASRCTGFEAACLPGVLRASTAVTTRPRSAGRWRCRVRRGPGRRTREIHWRRLRCRLTPTKPAALRSIVTAAKYAPPAGRFATAPTGRSPMSSLGEVVARGSRSVVHAYGRGAVIKVPKPGDARRLDPRRGEHVEAVRAVGAPAPALLGIEEVFGRPATVWERVTGLAVGAGRRPPRAERRPRPCARGGSARAVRARPAGDASRPARPAHQQDPLVGRERRRLARARRSTSSRSGRAPPRCVTATCTPATSSCRRTGLVLVDWFDASRGDRVADVARSSLTMLADGAKMPSHLPGSDPGTLAVLTRAYLSRLRESLDIPRRRLLARWQAINAVGPAGRGGAARAAARGLAAVRLVGGRPADGQAAAAG